MPPWRRRARWWLTAGWLWFSSLAQRPDVLLALGEHQDHLEPGRVGCSSRSRRITITCFGASRPVVPIVALATHCRISG